MSSSSQPGKHGGGDAMLEGFKPWPEERARAYRQKGYWEGLRLFEGVARSARRNPEKTALVAGERRISYGELIAVAERLAARFIGAGVRPLDRVVMQLHNTPEFAFTYLALTRIGVIPVMALRAHRLTEVRHFIDSAGAIGYVIPDQLARFDYRPLANQLRSECATLRWVWV